MNLDLAQKEFLKSEDGRKWFIKKVLEAVPKERNSQNIHTPYWFCEKVISKTTLENKKILVLYNIEFLEALINKFRVNSTNITFMADCQIEKEISEKIYKVKSIKIEKIEDIKKMINFDLCFSNPPYGTKSEHTHLRILLNSLLVCKEIIFVHPIKWILTINPKESLIKLVREKLNKKIKELEIVHPDIFKDPNIPDLLSITHIIVEQVNEKINIKWFENEYQADNYDDITIFSTNWINIVKPFLEKIKIFVDKNENIFGKQQPNRTYKKWVHFNPEDLQQNKKYCMFSGSSRGAIKHLNEKDIKESRMGSVYPILQVSSNNYYIKEYSQIKDEKGAYLKYWFDTEQEVENFLNYLRTNFARFCYSLSKGNNSLYDGALCLVPALDFTKEWTDETLYKYFEIPQETINYITNFFSTEKEK